MTAAVTRLAIFALHVCAACGEAAVQPAPVADAAIAPSTLQVVQPGDAIGLAFGERAILVVKLVGAGDRPLPGVPIGFAIVTDVAGESAGGSTLGAASVVSDAAGLAQSDLVAGAAAGSFRVRVTAPSAAPIFVIVTVSNTGFSSLDVAPVHLGMRDPVFPVEVRLYRGGARCAGLPPESPPASPYPVRSLASLDEVASFEALSPDADYAVLARASTSAGALAAGGCVDLAPRQLRPAVRVRLELPVADVPLAVAASYAATSTFDLAPARALVVGAGLPWSRAACARGAAELLLDCALDALDDRDPSGDCVVEDPGRVARLLDDRRGPVDASGCRTAALPGGVASLDTLVEAALTASGSRSPAAVLPGAAVGLADLIDSLTLESTLTIGERSLGQRLTRATLETGGALIHTSLGLTVRPILDSSAALGRTADSDEIGFASLAYTLRLGSLASSFVTSILGDVHRIGDALVAPASSSGLTGCAAVSAAACPSAGLEPTCLAAACTAALPALDGLLYAPLSRLDGTGIDFMLDGGGVLVDSDGDLVADQLLAGTWTTTLRLSDGVELRLNGAFQAAAK